MDRHHWASANYYRTLDRHMGITDIPTTHREFSALLDDYEREHFGYAVGGRAVADATLDLMTTVPPNNYAPKPVVRRFAPKYFRQMSSVRSYPDGYAVADLGTFPAGSAASAPPAGA